MARFNVVGLDDLQEQMLQRAKIAEEAVPEMLKAGGAVMQEAQRAEIRTMFRSRRSTGDLAASIVVSKIKERDNGKMVEVYPDGKDRHGVRNATKGFVLQYGRKNMPARPWFTAANEKAADDVVSLVKTTLEKLGYPVERLIYTGKAETFITYQIVVGLDTHFSDDESGAEEFTYRADIYSRVDYIALMRSAKRALKEAGFYGITFDPEVFEENTGYYHVPVEFKYMEV